MVWKTLDVLCRGGISSWEQSVTTSTLVVIERKCYEVGHIYTYQHLISDLPGCPQILPNGPTLKGGNIDLLCNLEDPGHPEPSRYLWKK